MASAARAMDDSMVVEEMRQRLGEHKTALLSLFQNGRTVQPTDNVIRFIAPLVLDHPIAPGDISLLAQVLDPNNTKFVVLKRVRDLVGKEEQSSALALGPSQQQRDGEHWQENQLSLAPTPPKRAPPTAPPTSAALLLAKQTQNEDPDKVAIMMALTWSGKHVSANTVKRFEAPVNLPPLARFIQPVTGEQVPYKFQHDIDLSTLYHCLTREIFDPRERGKVCIALVASYVLAEVALRQSVLGEGENAELVQQIVPSTLLHSFLSTHRMHRLRVLEEKSHDEFLRLSPVRLPLVITALRVEMESAMRQVAIFVLSYNHSARQVLPCWLALSERQRAAFCTSMWELHIWDEEIWYVLCNEESDSETAALLEVLLLPRQLYLENGGVESGAEAWEGQSEMQVWMERIQQEMDKVSAEASSLHQLRERPAQSEEEAEESFPPYWDENEQAEMMGNKIRALQSRVHMLCGEVWL